MINFNFQRSGLFCDECMHAGGTYSMTINLTSDFKHVSIHSVSPQIFVKNRTSESTYRKTRTEMPIHIKTVNTFRICKTLVKNQSFTETIVQEKIFTGSR